MSKKKILMSILLVFTIILTGCSIPQRDIVDTSLAEKAYWERQTKNDGSAIMQEDVVEEIVEVDMTLISPIEE